MKPEQWKSIPSKILKSELIKRDVSYEELSKKLIAMGLNAKKETINVKLSRGNYRADFFIQCLRALEVKTLQLDDVLFKDEKNVD